VHPGLVADLDGDGDVGEQVRAAADDRVLRVPGGVGVEVEEVGVAHTGAGWPAGDGVPDGLEQHAGGEPPVVEAERRRPVEHRRHGRVGPQDREEALLVAHTR